MEERRGYDSSQKKETERKDPTLPNQLTARVTSSKKYQRLLCVLQTPRFSGLTSTTSSSPHIPLDFFTLFDRLPLPILSQHLSANGYELEFSFGALTEGPGPKQVRERNAEPLLLPGS